MITEKLFQQAIHRAKHEVDSIVKRFNKTSWQVAIGASGSIKHIYQIINHHNELAQPITLAQVSALKDKLIKQGHVKRLNIEGLKPARQEIICAGIAIVIAVMERLSITELHYSPYALREGVLYEQLENLSSSATTHDNVRQRSVNSLAQRFNVDTTQISIIQQLINTWLNQLCDSWHFTSSIYLELIMSAVQLHEIGNDVNPSGYHKHGRYILSHTDLAGFNQEQQQALAWLIGSQRKKIQPLSDLQWHLLSSKELMKLCILLRLAILLCQQRQAENDIQPSITTHNNVITILLEQQWLINRPIVDTELFYEKMIIESLGYDLILQVD
jgi:exopolyphosphatase/guanosine-5'-triphosphate,3'-diphosphate pyrophosphatase